MQPQTTELKEMGMSDARLRELDRLALVGDAEAGERADRARCQIGRHAWAKGACQVCKMSFKDYMSPNLDLAFSMERDRLRQLCEQEGIHDWKPGEELAAACGCHGPHRCHPRFCSVCEIPEPM